MLSGAVAASRSAAPLFGADADRLAGTDATLRARLGEQRHRGAVSRGAALTDDDAVSFAVAAIERLRT